MLHKAILFMMAIMTSFMGLNAYDFQSADIMIDAIFKDVKYAARCENVCVNGMFQKKQLLIIYLDGLDEYYEQIRIVKDGTELSFTIDELWIILNKD
jgi:hypothetical protein